MTFDLADGEVMAGVYKHTAVVRSSHRMKLGK